MLKLDHGSQSGTLFKEKALRILFCINHPRFDEDKNEIAKLMIMEEKVGRRKFRCLMVKLN